MARNLRVFNCSNLDEMIKCIKVLPGMEGYKTKTGWEWEIDCMIYKCIKVLPGMEG